MGRQVKRVSMDFKWPLNKVWEGFVNPHWRKCPHCEAGATSAHLRLKSLVRLILLSGEDTVRMEFVGYDAVPGHEGLQAAFKRHDAKRQIEEAKRSEADDETAQTSKPA